MRLCLRECRGWALEKKNRNVDYKPRGAVLRGGSSSKETIVTRQKILVFRHLLGSGFTGLNGAGRGLLRAAGGCLVDEKLEPRVSQKRGTR